MTACVVYRLPDCVYFLGNRQCTDQFLEFYAVAAITFYSDFYCAGVGEAICLCDLAKVGFVVLHSGLCLFSIRNNFCLGKRDYMLHLCICSRKKVLYFYA